jgi:hypothetical protein
MAARKPKTVVDPCPSLTYTEQPLTLDVLPLATASPKSSEVSGSVGAIESSSSPAFSAPCPPPSTRKDEVHGAIVPMIYGAIGVAVIGGAVIDAVDLAGSVARHFFGGQR